MDKCVAEMLDVQDVQRGSRQMVCGEQPSVLSVFVFPTRSIRSRQLCASLASLSYDNSDFDPATNGGPRVYNVWWC